MIGSLKKWVIDRTTQWLTREGQPAGPPLCDFDRIRFETRPCDVLLIEGRSRISDVIKNITQSPWTHAALYIGRPSEIEDPDLRTCIEWHYDGDPHQQLILEALLGEGTILSPLTRYQHEHIRICRPKGLSPADARRVTAYAARHLSCDYDVRQLLDLARFLLPYGILPRRWRSSLFRHRPGQSTRTVCSSLIASAFTEVHFPIIPVVRRTENGDVRLYKRNSRLFTPSDFDYSPYFDIIKYPFMGFEDIAIYRRLPWDQEGLICNGEDDCYLPAELLTELDDGTGEAERAPPATGGRRLNLLRTQRTGAGTRLEDEAI